MSPTQPLLIQDKLLPLRTHSMIVNGSRRIMVAGPPKLIWWSHSKPVKFIDFGLPTICGSTAWSLNSTAVTETNTGRMALPFRHRYPILLRKPASNFPNNHNTTSYCDLAALSAVSPFHAFLLAD